MLDLFVGFAQLPVHAVALGEENVSGADDHGEQGRVEEDPAVHVQPQSVERANTSDREQADHCGLLGFHGKRQHRGGEDEEGARARIDGLEPQPQQHHAANVDEIEGVLDPEETKIQNEEYSRAEGVVEPQFRANVTQNWIDEKEAQIENPEQRAPAVILIFEYGAPRLQLPVAAVFGADVSLQG